MERVSYRLTNEIAGRRDTRIIAWGHSQLFLPWFAALSFVRALVIGMFGDIELIHLGDLALGGLGYVLGHILRVPVVVTVHGLDVIYPNWLYQRYVTMVLPTFAAVIAVSRATQVECLVRGVRPDRCFVVSNGVDPPAIDLADRSGARTRLAHTHGIVLDDRSVLLTTGRLVRRKGVAWFVENVLPTFVRAHPDTAYLIVGSGSDEARIREAIKNAGVAGRVFLLGRVDNETLWDAYRACDLFVMPNVEIPGDMEGFGLVAIEAGLAERYVIASDLQGIRDAVVPPFNGELTPAGDANAMASAIVRLFAPSCDREARGREARRFVLDRFAWTAIASEYLRIFDACRPTARRT